MSMTPQGYIRFKCKGHPLAGSYNIVMVHRAVASGMVGRWLRPDELVHHINGDITDNRPENLRVTDSKNHAGLHRCPLVCAICGRPHHAKGLCQRCYSKSQPRKLAQRLRRERLRIARRQRMVLR